MPRAADLTGIRRTATGWAVWVRVRPLPPAHQRFPPETPLRTLLEARDTLRAELRRRRNDRARQAPTAGSFAADAERYLAAVASLPSIRDRRWMLGLWVAQFGSRHRRDLTSADIRTALASWPTYSPRTLRHLRATLMHLWTVLDGKAAPNPVRDVPAPRLPDDLSRDLPPAAVRAILDQIAPTSKARAVLELMYATGMTPTEISRLEPTHVLPDALVALGRRKGAGTRPRALPLTPDARAARALFVAAEAWGGVTLKTANAAWRRAKEKAGYGDRDWKAYDLRHTYLTAMAAGGDDRVVQHLAGHSSERMTRRYTLGSVPARVAAVVATVVAKRPDNAGHPQTLPDNPPITPADVTPPESAKIRRKRPTPQAKP
jgi:integrase